MQANRQWRGARRDDDEEDEDEPSSNPTSGGRGSMSTQSAGESTKG